ncbi:MULTISPECIES: TadE/TadG family type IV pilus assembly protein [unclassified Ruegeria]|uniref:TadE/TadG family type IV pilus assembly protein n=1 Tax=unclassified Ruegeria TaxID=2625375 RepID=UPI001492C591|nr:MULTISPECIES: TadE/TadG family type IV pilus assembly protein [unclassified Ruegeria]NOD88216.1 pilus assembly protein [Ruegeria sp. HKCCD4318]NOE13125.1 pilus assembly protein [Ruegeria sp. HKCCD4318-2]NOG11333.1 pilus assembly protein [Ruegeria sp. HKCCD4315]
MIFRRKFSFKHFAKNDDGAILVEFGLVMPVMLLLLAVTLESARLMWSYQSVIAGVRDASRYLSRVTPSDICTSGGSVAGFTTTLKSIVEQDINGNNLFPPSVTVNSVTPSLTCVSGTYRMNPAPVGQVSANITIQFPLGGILALFGSGATSVTTDVADTSRIFGQ